ncbi:RBBP9/YdeN family alpha/beta hydrolase [Hymenobacter koreensis]|uniref:Alpha/beta hydrolase n=1 Tax=Hymenobacter koreensis TaxID=1084523 RepID=A0ABP8JII3_9BACT
MLPVKHVYVVPRWGGNSCSDWYPWLKVQLEEIAAEDNCRYVVSPLNMPAWDVPVIGNAVDYLAELLPAERILNEETYLVGHSVGCLAILHHLAEVAKQEPQARVGGVLCVAGWFLIDNPWQDILNWMDAPIDYEGARRLIPEDKLTVLLSDDDPYTTGYQQNQKLWLERMHASVNILPGRQHFSKSLDLDVRDAIRDLAGAFNGTAPVSVRAPRS